jgi:glycosyltransferase involved in cell wall biosynthesis
MFLESLSQQTFKQFEVIIVDGGSDDGWLDAVHGYELRLNIRWITDLKKNIGYIRNVAAKHARGDIMLQTSTDIRFEPDLLDRLDREFCRRPELVALGGKTMPVGRGAGHLSKLAYWGFDSLRAFFTSKFLPNRWRKFRPAGNFLAIYRSLFWELGGYPEVRINEDGLFGYSVDDYVRETGLRASFSLDYGVEHNVKRWEKSGIKGLLFYIYVLANFFPILEPVLKPLEEKRAEQFSTRRDLITEEIPAE